MTLAEFDELLMAHPFTRRIDAVHFHHTWRPNHSQYRGYDTIVSMWRYHTEVKGWSDIAQHLTIAPDVHCGRAAVGISPLVARVATTATGCPVRS